MQSSRTRNAGVFHAWEKRGFSRNLERYTCGNYSIVKMNLNLDSVDQLSCKHLCNSVKSCWIVLVLHNIVLD